MILIIYYIVINIFAFILMGLDKWKAIKQKRRIKESNIFFLAFIGGALGVWLAMYQFRHKTRKKHFAVGVPFVVMVQYTLILFWYVKNYI